MPFQFFILYHVGRDKGRKEGRKEGEKRGEKRGELNLLKKLYRQKILTKTQYERRGKPLMKKMN